MTRDNSIEYDWQGVGKAEIEVESNHSAVIRYKVSPEAAEETLAKIAKKAHKRDFNESNKTTNKK